MLHKLNQISNQNRLQLASSHPGARNQNSDLASTAFDYAAPLVCGLSVMLLRRADWLHAAGSASLGVFTAAAWGIAFTLLTALTTAALSRLIGLHNQSPKRTWLHEQGLILLAAASAVLAIATTAHLVGAFGFSGQLVALNIGLTAAVMSLSRTLWRRRTASDAKHSAIAKNFTMKILPAR
jgi:hypothetical protein